MNTGKQINAMVAVLFLTLIAIGAYTIWDPTRSSKAEERQEEDAAGRGATTFALNCRLCHGDRGQGGANGGRLPAAPALNDGRLQGLDKGTFSQAEYDADFKLVTNTIMCGRVGTKMPTWGQLQGGTLNEEQIRQLAILITKDYFDLAQEHADEVDAATTRHATVDMPDGSLTADGTDLTVNNASPFTLGEYIRIQDERLRVRPKSVEVERGVDGTTAAKHDRGAAVTVAGAAPSPAPQRGAVRPPTPALGEPVDAKVTALSVSDTSGFAVGDVLQVEDEHVRVTSIVTGLPTTNEKLAKEIGREPKKLLVTGAEGLEVGQIIRLEGELLEVTAIHDDGDTKAVIDQDTTASDALVSFSDPLFFAAGYVVRVADEQMRVVGPVDTRQTLADTIGRAQTHFSVSGTRGLSTGMTIRLGEEEMRIVEIVSPAHVVVERGDPDADGNATTKTDHAAGVEFLQPQTAAEGETTAPAPKATGQTLLRQAGAEDTSIDVTGTAGISPGQAYLLGGELVNVTDVVPAEVRVERAVNDTKLTEHPRRSPIFEANLLEVERGVNGTAAAAHTAGDQVLMTSLDVKREAGGSKVADHAKNAQLFLGNRLNVQRGALKTDAVEHANGELVRDFPPPPDSPTDTPSACGQLPRATEAPAPVATAIPGGQDVGVSMAEFSVTVDKPSVLAGITNITVTNDGTILHNFRLIATELPADQLPLDSAGTGVDESKVNVVQSLSRVDVGQSLVVPIQQLAAGNYVLICNVPTHYGQAMYTAFTVTP